MCRRIPFEERVFARGFAQVPGALVSHARTGLDASIIVGRTTRTGSPGGRPNVEEPRLPFLILQAQHYTLRALDEAVRPHGISASQLGVIRLIDQNPGISAAGISREMYTTPQAAQLMLQTLERKGLIERKPDPDDRRVVEATLTPEGERLVAACTGDAIAAAWKLATVLQPAELGLLTDLLEKYLSNAMRQAPAGGNEQLDK